MKQHAGLTECNPYEALINERTSGSLKRSYLQPAEPVISATVNLETLINTSTRGRGQML